MKDKSRTVIVDAYVNHFKEEGHPPVSVYKFCKSLKITEKYFYQQFASFDVVEEIFWQEMLEEVITSVRSGKEWKAFGAQEQTLAFLYAFFENALNHRTLMLYRFGKISVMEKPLWLRGFEASYKDLVKTILKKGTDSQEIASRSKLQNLYPEAFYLHLRGLIDFHLKDTSEGYEKTDALIEKSVRFIFDLLRTSALESAFDLAKMMASLMNPASTSATRRPHSTTTV